MKSIAADVLAAAVERRARMERMGVVRPPVSRARAIEATVDVPQVPIRSSANLTEPTSGELAFVVGYSRIGGTDAVS